MPSQLVTQDSTAGLTEELFKGKDFRAISEKNGGKRQAYSVMVTRNVVKS